MYFTTAKDVCVRAMLDGRKDVAEYIEQDIRNGEEYAIYDVQKTFPFCVNISKYMPLAKPNIPHNYYGTDSIARPMSFLKTMKKLADDFGWISQNTNSRQFNRSAFKYSDLTSEQKKEVLDVKWEIYLPNEVYFDFETALALSHKFPFLRIQESWSCPLFGFTKITKLIEKYDWETGPKAMREDQAWARANLTDDVFGVCYKINASDPFRNTLYFRDEDQARTFKLFRG